MTGYVEGRNITDTVRSVLGILDYAKKNSLSGVMLCLDFEKAFDSLSFSFMFKALKAFNFGDGFIKWVKVLYNSVESCIINNGVSSGFFPVMRGVRQGDPLSAYLFILSLEILSHAIRTNDSIEGVTIGENTYKLGQFADDTTSFLKNEKSVKNLFSLLKEFESISGLKINVEKTEAMWLNPRETKQTIYNIRIKQSVKLLGLIIHHDSDEMEKLNLETKLTEMSNTFKVWRQRNLTIYGRILLAKSLGASKLCHIASVIEISDFYIKRIESCLYAFIWNGKNDKVKRNILISDYEKGGLNMVHFKSVCEKYKLKWIQKCLNPESAGWKSILQYYLTPYGGIDLFLRSTYDVSELLFIPNFYRSIFKTWKWFITKLKGTRKNPFIWNNECIKINNATTFKAGTFKCGLWYISDLYDDKKQPIPFETWIRRGFCNTDYFTWRSLVASTFHMRDIQWDMNELVLEIYGKPQNYERLTAKQLYLILKMFVECKGPNSRTQLSEEYDISCEE